MKLNLTKQEAKSLLVRYHMINTNDHLFGKDAIMTVMNRLQSIQVDPLDVVGKNIDLVMQSRITDYKRNLIQELLYTDRTLIDGWDKMMAVYKTEDYPYLHHIRESMCEGHRHNILKRFDFDILQYKDHILELIKESPKYSKDINLGERIRYGYNTAKTSSVTLDYLYYKGEIGVKSRTNTQKEYDILSNLIGDISQTKTPLSTPEEFTEYLLHRRIKSLGLTSNKSGVHLSGPYISKKTNRNVALQSLLEKELVHEVTIEDVKDVYYIPDEALHLTNEIIDQISFIAPLDNLIWERDLIENLFDFKYRWEVYTPKAKREYGYYVLPILYQSEFIGRIEFEKHRKKEKLNIINKWIDYSNYDKKLINKLLKEALKRFETYLKH